MKMKKIALLLSVVLFTCCVTSKVSKVEIDPISKIVPVDKTQNQLYLIANDWMIKTFTNAESVIQFTDKESGTIAGKYLMGMSLVTSPGLYSVQEYKSVYSIIKIQVKDNAAKITITPNSYNNLTMSYYGIKDDGYPKEQAISDINNLIEDFNKYMKHDHVEF